MPTYGGGKAKIGKEIYEVITKVQEKIGYQGVYFEPFCGMLGVGIHFAQDGQKIIANDLNKDIIMMWKALQKGWEPPRTCSRKKYEQLKYSNVHSAERGFLGIACAYSGIFFAGYRPKNEKQNYLLNSRNSILDMKKWLKQFKFYSKDYREFKPKNMTIYCDPPYKDNKFKSQYFDDFDHNEFWNTMRKWSKDNLVLISEYTAPKDFKAIWKYKMNSTYNSTVKKRIEKLYIYTG